MERLNEIFNRTTPVTSRRHHYPTQRPTQDFSGRDAQEVGQGQRPPQSPLPPEPGTRRAARPLPEQNARQGQPMPPYSANTQQVGYQPDGTRVRSGNVPTSSAYRPSPHASEGRERIPSTATRPLYPRTTGQNGNPSYPARAGYGEDPPPYRERTERAQHTPLRERPMHDYTHEVDDYAPTLHADVAHEWEEDDTAIMGYGDWESDDTPPTYRQADIEIVTHIHQEDAPRHMLPPTETGGAPTRRLSNTHAIHDIHATAYPADVPARSVPAEPESRHYQRITQPLNPQMSQAHSLYREREQVPPAPKAQLVPSVQKTQAVQPAQPRQIIQQEPTHTITIPSPVTHKVTCQRCKGAGYLRADVPFGHPNFGKPIPCICKEQERKEKRRQQLREMSNLEAFREKTFRTFNPNVPGVQEAYQVASEYAKNPDGWLLLIGRSGSGKTHLAAAVANQALNDGALVFFTVVPDLLFELRASISSKSPETQEQLFLKMREAEVLILDDFGAHRNSAWTTEQLFQLLNYRYNMEMPTIITTNPEGLQGADPRILSRLTDNSLVSIVKMERARDYRPNHPRA